MEILSMLLQITIYSGIIFFVTMLIKTAFKPKMSPFLHFAIWAVFLLRLIVPVTLEAPLHFFTYPTAENAPVPIQSTYSLSEISTMYQHDTPAEKDNEAINKADFKSDALVTVNAKPIQTTAARTTLLSTEKIVLIVWLGGAVLGILYISLLSVMLWRKIARRSAPTSAHIQCLLSEVKEELHIKAHLRLLCQYEYCSPALLFPRTILMPIDKLVKMSDAQIKNCLRHECMHYKRGDHLTSLLLTVLNAVYWFNPFMWLAYFEIRKDMETACDGAVVRHLPLSARRDYADLILTLSVQSRHFQLALGMTHGLKNAERRIKGVFMAQKTKRSVKFVSLVLTAVLTFCCFTTACQPTPLVPPVVNKASGISAEMIADPLLQDAVKKVDAPQHWTETMTLQDGRMQISADVDVKIPDNLSNTPVYKVEQVELTPKRLEELTHYFVSDSKLYKPAPITKFEGMEQLKKLKDPQSSFGEYDEGALTLMADELQKMIDDAPDTAKKVYTDLSLTLPYKTENTRVLEAYVGDLSAPQSEKYVDVFAETGEEYEPMISASTYDSAAGISGRFAFTYPGSIMSTSDMNATRQRINWDYSYSSYRDQDLVQSYMAAFNKYYSQLDDVIDMITETPDQAQSAAQGVLDDLGIVDMKLDTIEKGIWQPRQPQEWDEFSTPVSKMQGGYMLTFTRSAGQLAGFRLNYGGMTTEDMLTYTPPFRVEQIIMFVSNGKIIAFDWRGMAKAIETVAANTNLLPFDEIKNRLSDYLSNNYLYQEGSDGEPSEDSIHIDILSVELRSSQITAKDDPYRAWLVPTWLFWFRNTHSDEYNKEDIVDQDYPCEINALDGGIIIPLK